jgi:FG-GAP repeat protein
MLAVDLTVGRVVLSTLIGLAFATSAATSPAAHPAFGSAIPSSEAFAPRTSDRAIGIPHARAAASSSATPSRLPASDGASIRAAYEAGRHAAFAVEGGYRARNPGQQWTTLFDGRGFTTTPDGGRWTWGLELVSYGTAGAKRSVSQPQAVTAEGQRVAYEWDGSLTEWYVNDRRGFEHGYTVHSRPAAGACPLTLALAIRGGLVPVLSEGGRDMGFVDAEGNSVLTYAGLTVLDADGRALPAAFERVLDGLQLSVDDRGARYPLTIDPIAQQAYMKASNTGVNDHFGWSVSVSGDTAVVGAENEDSSATGVNGNQSDNGASSAGAAYVFVRDGTTWSQQAYLKASNTEATDSFGTSVSVSGDTVVVGAYREDSAAPGVNGNQSNNSATNSGAAYVFARNGSTWSQEAYLKASNPGTNDQFGISVSVSGDTVVVGANAEDSSATGVNGNQFDNTASGAGAAYVFVRNGTTWSQQAYLKASNTGASDQFGDSVSVSGDTVVVGAYLEASSATGVNGNQSDNSASGFGAAYVFDLDDNPGTSSYGTGSAGCAGTHTLDVNHAPMTNSPHFAITCDNAPPSSLGLGLLTNAQDLAGSDPFAIGALLHVDLFSATELYAFDFVSDASGNAQTVGVSIPNIPALVGNTYYAMALWAWTSCSLPPFNLSTSRGLALTILVP